MGVARARRGEARRGEVGPASAARPSPVRRRRRLARLTELDPLDRLARPSSLTRLIGFDRLTELDRA